MKITTTVLAAVSAMTFAGAAQATVLTFDINPSVTNSDPVNQAYGDRVTAGDVDASGGGGAAAGTYGTDGGATGNVVVDYFGGDPSVWTTGYNDLTNVFYDEDDGSDAFGFTLTAEAGYNVIFESMDIGNFAGELTLPEITISTDTVSFSVTDIVLQASGFNSTPLGTSGGIQGQFVTVTVSTFGLGGASDNVGLDNIRFSQTAVATSAIPLPAGLPLMLAGLGAFGLIRRRK